LAAHDFMDYDITDATNPMGMDGCIDFDHSANAGLSDIWCDDCDLTAIYNAGYASSMSRADFWVASANAVIFITSGEELDLKDTFAFGRTTAETCGDSATRLPEDSSCNFVEDVFLTRMDMSWTNAVALLGAHTLGRGSINFSGHDGIWVNTVDESLVFDKRYYEEIFRRAWVPRNLDDNGVPQDFTWGNRNNNGSPRFMLNTDLCLAFDIDTTRSPDNAVFPCCTRNDLTTNNGGNQCEIRVDGFDTTGLANHTCSTYLPQDPRIEAANAVNLFSSPRTRPDGSQGFSNDNTAFFEAFREAWSIATTNGLSGLQPLTQTCDTFPPTATPTAAPQLPTSSPSSSEPSRSPTVDPTLHVSLLYMSFVITLKPSPSHSTYVAFFCLSQQRMNHLGLLPRAQQIHPHMNRLSLQVPSLSLPSQQPTSQAYLPHMDHLSLQVPSRSLPILPLQTLPQVQAL